MGDDLDAIRRYVINLKERSDRRSEIQKQLLAVGWDAHILEAVRPAEAGPFPSIGSRGCFLSHLMALKEGMKQNCHVLILEDDLSFTPQFNFYWQAASNALRNIRWSIFYPGHTLPLKQEGLIQIRPETPIECAHFVLFHQSAVASIVANLETILARRPGDPRGGPMHVDGAYSTIRAQDPTLATFVFSPSLGYQRSSRSDIAPLRFFDRVAFARPIVGLARKIKRGFKYTLA